MVSHKVSEHASYYNDLLPVGFHLCSMSELASGIVSTALQCGTGRCPTDDLQLDTPVRITIEHSDTVKVVTN